MNPTTNKSGRDTAFYALATVVSGVIASKYGLDVVAAGAVGTVVFGVLSFGWRVLRHYAPWVDEAA
jgi:hypothetical protein